MTGMNPTLWRSSRVSTASPCWRALRPAERGPGKASERLGTFSTGRLVYAELKVAKNRPTPAQEMWLAALRKSGVEVYVWYPEDFPEIVAVAERRAA